MLQENHVLTAEQIAEFNKNGSNLDPKKLYIYKFLFNDKWNNAQDPRPFRIKPSLVDKLAKDAVGMPYVVNPENTGVHLRGKKDPNSAKELLELQANFSIGVIRVPVIKESNNVYGIIEVWPEFEDEIEKLPVFTSPTLAIIKEDQDGIDDANFLNINAVDSPGYPEKLSNMMGICKNGIKECVAELSILGASGTLKENRSHGQIFLNKLFNHNKAMSTESGTTGTNDGTTEPKPEPTLTDVVKAVEEVAVKVDEVKVIEEKVVENVENNNVVLKEVATKTEGVDETKVMEKIEESPASDLPADTPTEPPIVGASGNQKTLTIPKDLKNHPFVQDLVNNVKLTQKQLDEIKRESQSRKDAEALALRTAQATSIVTKQILLKQVKEADKDKEIKKYVELKNQDGKPEDLTVLDNYLKGAVPSDDPEVVGASGYQFPELGNDHTETVNNAEAMGFDA